MQPITQTKELEEIFCIDNSSLFSLSSLSLSKALSLQGENYLLQLSYEDVAQELKERKLTQKINEALSILVCFYDDGTKFNTIESFSRYLYNATQKTQYLKIGVTQSKNKSHHPVTIFFSGILPINQLNIVIEKNLYCFIEQHQEKLKEKFQATKERLLRELGTIILPVEHYPKENITPNTLYLEDAKTGSKLCECRVENNSYTPEEIIDDYLEKLYFVYKKLLTTKGGEYANFNNTTI